MWMGKETAGNKPSETFFASVTPEDMERERKVEQLVDDNLAQWQEDGLIPDMAIEPGDKTEEPIRARGWTYWHHLFNARQLLTQAIAFKAWRHSPAAALVWIYQAKAADLNSRLCRWASGKRHPGWRLLQSDPQRFAQLCGALLGRLRGERRTAPSLKKKTAPFPDAVFFFAF